MDAKYLVHRVKHILSNYKTKNVIDIIRKLYKELENLRRKKKTPNISYTAVENWENKSLNVRYTAVENWENKTSNGRYTAVENWENKTSNVRYTAVENWENKTSNVR